MPSNSAPDVLPRSTKDPLKSSLMSMLAMLSVPPAFLSGFSEQHGGYILSTRFSREIRKKTFSPLQASSALRMPRVHSVPPACTDLCRRRVAAGLQPLRMEQASCRIPLRCVPQGIEQVRRRLGHEKAPAVRPQDR